MYVILPCPMFCFVDNFSDICPIPQTHTHREREREREREGEREREREREILDSIIFR